MNEALRRRCREPAVDLSAQTLAVLLAANASPKPKNKDYGIVTQLPPNKDEGYFMAPSPAKLPNGTLMGALLPML